VLHFTRIDIATNCNEAQGVETGLYARSYAHLLPILTINPDRMREAARYSYSTTLGGGCRNLLIDAAS
jgi:hypothetical protein